MDQLSNYAGAGQNSSVCLAIGATLGAGSATDKADVDLPTDKELARDPAFTGLGHSKLESTVKYLGIEVDDALELAEQTEV